MSASRATTRAVDPPRLARLYVIVLGLGLLLDGGGLLVLDRLGVPTPVYAGDTRHNLLHLMWGVALLAVIVLAADGRELGPAWAAVIFGTFYTALGVVGLTLDQPFGLQLGPGENGFHLTVGPLALLLGGWALRSSSLTSADYASQRRSDAVDSSQAG